MLKISSYLRHAWAELLYPRYTILAFPNYEMQSSTCSLISLLWVGMTTYPAVDNDVKKGIALGVYELLPHLGMHSTVKQFILYRSFPSLCFSSSWYNNISLYNEAAWEVTHEHDPHQYHRRTVSVITLANSTLLCTVVLGCVTNRLTLCGDIINMFEMLSCGLSNSGWSWALYRV